MQIRLSNINKRFFSLRGEVAALHDITLEIHDGEFFVLLGPSGCGKSTLLNCIAGLEKPTRGEIFFADTLIASKEKRIFFSPKERNISFVFQNYALYPHLTVFENIAFPLKVVGTKEKIVKEAVQKTASILEISELLSAKPAELSGGQRQRVAIARAIVRKPNLFLLDEPLSNLDAQLRTAMRAELKTLQRQLGITTIYVTHDQVEAMSLGDRIAVLRQGKIEQIDTPQGLYEHPANTFVAQFVGSPAMNLIKASYKKEQGQFFITIGSKKLKAPENKIALLKKLPSPSFILGLRPEHISLHPASQILQGAVIAVEPLGKETVFYVRMEEQKIIILSSEKMIKKEGPCDIALSLEKSHIFSTELKMSFV